MTDVDLASAVSSLILAYWQGIIAFAALIVAVLTFLLHRREAAIEHFARFVEFGPMPEELTVPAVSGNIQVKVTNPTGSPQIVRDLWLRPIDYEDLDDPQIERLGKYLQLFGSAAKQYFAQPEWKTKAREAVANTQSPGKGLLQVLGGILNIVDRVTTGTVSVRGRARYLEFAINAMLRDLDQLAKPRSKSELRAWADLVLTERDPIDLIAPDERIPVSKSINMDIEPKKAGAVEVDFSQFLVRCRRSLQFIGGRFSFTCLLEARVHGGSDVQSDLFQLTTNVEPLDLDSFGEQLRKGFGEL